jgi:hypothetical protein
MLGLLLLAVRTSSAKDVELLVLRRSKDGSIVVQEPGTASGMSGDRPTSRRVFLSHERPAGGPRTRAPHQRASGAEELIGYTGYA